MEITTRKNQTRIVNGNTEILVNKLEENIDKSMFDIEQKKVAIRIRSDIYDFILEHFGERGFTKFYHVAALELIEKMRTQEEKKI